MNARKALKDLGLSEKETDVYFAVLELGESPIAHIAQKSGIKRPTAYLAVESLERRGYITKHTRKNKTFFKALHPQKLVSEAEVRLREIQDAVPQLESLFQKEGSKPRITIYEGKEMLDRAFDEMFIEKGDAMYMGSLPLSKDVLPKTYQRFVYATLSPDFTVRELLDDSEEAKAYVEEVSGTYRKVRFMPRYFRPFEMDITIFGNHVLITSVKKEHFTVSIESPEIARAFRSIYDVVWEVSQEA